MMFAVIGMVYVPSAHATLEPADCNTSAQSLTLTWYRSDKSTTVLGSNSPITNQLNKVDIGEELFLQATLSSPLLTSPNKSCNYLNGTLYVTTPDLVDHLLSAEVPLISNVSMFSNFTGSYFANASDDTASCDGSVDGLANNKLTSCAFYGNSTGAPIGAIDGVSHSSDEGEDTANASNDAGVNFVIPFNATTLANATGIQDNPVSNPLDIVTIEANANYTNAFTGNFTLGNSTNAFETGACTGGAVNATTGIATLTCQASGTYDTPVGDTCFDVTINAPSPYAPKTITLLGADDAENECFKIRPPQWNATTLSNVTGTQGFSVINPIDTVSIVANENFTGIFTGNFTLGNSTTVFDTGSCTGGAVNATTGNATLTCESSATIDEFDGETCFDVTVNAPSPYEPITDILFGADDSENECFVVNPPEWNATTQANVTGTQNAPVSNPLDIVTVIADQNFLGNFTGNFTLGNGTDVFDSGDCTEGAVNATTGIATLECQAAGTYENEQGEICFDVTINAPSPYTPVADTLLGADDSENECFELRTDVPYDAYTMSNVTGIVGPTINPGDIVFINGTDGLFGNFTGNATLTFNSTDTVATTDCSYVNGTEYPLEMECGAEIELVEPGQYCWDVTITETTGNYTPSVLNLFGIDDPENECFNVFEGLTPGFWKSNAENWDAGAWYEDPETDFFQTVFNATADLKLPKGKNITLEVGTEGNSTLYGALGARGGDENALARHCVAAKLNAENPDVTYPLNKTQVIDQCGDALNSKDKTIINDLKDLLDEWNNFGANISQHWVKP